MKMTESILRRYTTLPSLLHILHEKRITLLNPANWDDSNDSHSLNLYKSEKEFKTLLAICFSEAVETYHHWHVFAGDSSGICISFYKDKLLKNFREEQGFMHGSVIYKPIQDLRTSDLKLEELPYIKRQGYSDEMEYRVIYKSSKDEVKASKEVTISLDCIAKITLNPWLHKSLVAPIKKTITQAAGEERLAKYIFRSTLTGNSEWKKILGRFTRKNKT